VLTEMCAAPGSPATIGALVDAFVEDAQIRVAEVRKALQARDLAALMHLAHELKGGSATIGAVGLAGVAVGVQRRVRVAAGRPTLLASDVEDLERLIDLAGSEFRRAELALRAASQEKVL
jgi:HPt (histidine-containing phosphotransfer) domain-containing protein